MQSLTPEFDYRPCSKGPSFVILLLLLCSISSCLTLLVNIVGERPAPAPTCANASPRIAKTAPASQAKDLPTCVPQDSFKMKYDNDPDYEGWSTNVTEHWAALLPANNGLGQEDSFNEGIPYGIAMFHQLHCLHAIREYYTILLGAPGVDAADAELVRSVGQRAHIGHCFNWVRQVSQIQRV